MQVWTADERGGFFAILAEKDDRYYVPFFVHAMTGARRGEVPCRGTASISTPVCSPTVYLRTCRRGDLNSDASHIG
jgi:hypothetical protein